ncbi:MAG: recombinase family protein [Leptolyngbyaceae cyanobacterium]
MFIVAYACISLPLDPEVDAASFGQPIDRLYIDHFDEIEGRSALARLLQDCQQQPPDRLYVRQVGELGNSLSAVLQTIHQLETQGVAIRAIDESYVTPALAAASLPGTAVEADPAAAERDRTAQLAETILAQHRSQQLRAGHARNRVNILPPPGRAPYGYRRGRYRYALDRATAPAVKSFFEHFILYGSIRGSARHLEKTYGKRVSASTAQRWLLHPVYRGDSRYQDGRVIRDTHTAIISREEAAQVDRLLRRNRKLPPKTVSARRSLAGLVQCQACQSKLKVSRVTRPRQTREYLYLRPTACDRAKKCRAIAFDAVLAQTIDAICTQLPQAVDNLPTPPVGAIKAGLVSQVEHKQQVLSQIAELQQQGILDEASAQLRTYTLQGELSGLQQELSQLPPENLKQIAQTLSSREFWQDLSEVERRVYLREFVRAVWIVRDQEDWQVQVQFVF